MKNEKKRSRALLLFYLLFAYILLQFTWWTYALFQLNNENADLRRELNFLRESSPEQIISKGNEINTRLQKRWTMIAGESAVFIGLLLLGLYRIRDILKKEEELSARQKNFLLSVSHELKSPLASTKLQLQTLEKHELPRDKQKEIIANAINDTERLNNLVENILLAAKIENKISLHLQVYNISDYIRQGMDQTINAFQYSHNILLKIQPEIFLPIDRTTFPSIILNLIENAVKYSPPHSTVTLALQKNKHEIILSVSDEGTGIAEADKKYIFDKFYRAGNEETRKTKGTGLGLFITKYLVEQHKGEINITNNHPRGSIFEIRFQVV